MRNPPYEVSLAQSFALWNIFWNNPKDNLKPAQTEDLKKSETKFLKK